MCPLHGRVQEVERKQSLLDDPLHGGEREAAVGLHLLQLRQRRPTGLLHDTKVWPEVHAQGAIAVLGSRRALVLLDLEVADIVQVAIALRVDRQPRGEHVVERLEGDEAAISGNGVPATATRRQTKLNVNGFKAACQVRAD